MNQSPPGNAVSPGCDCKGPFIAAHFCCVIGQFLATSPGQGRSRSMPHFRKEGIVISLLRVTNRAGTVGDPRQ